MCATRFDYGKYIWVNSPHFVYLLSTYFNKKKSKDMKCLKISYNYCNKKTETKIFIGLNWKMKKLLFLFFWIHIISFQSGRMNQNPQMFMKRVGPFSNPHQQRQKIYNHPYMENTRIYEVSVPTYLRLSILYMLKSSINKVPSIYL